MWIHLLLITGSAVALAQVPQIAGLGLSALPLAILLGMLYGNLYPTKGNDEGAVNWCQRRALRLGIVLFGFNLSLQQVAALGWQLVLVDTLVICVVLAVGIGVGMRLLGLSRELAVLTSVGSAVCGAAAIAEPVARAREQDVAVAVATVVLFGTLATFCYPLIYSLCGWEESVFGIYIGSTVHEVAQAVAAGQSIGADAMQSALVAKLVRVMLLAPVVVFLGSVLFRARGGERRGASAPLPGFVFGFALAVGLNSVLVLPQALQTVLQLASQGLLALGMAALGVKARWRSIRSAGARPLLLSSLLFLLLLGGGFVLNAYFYR
ncbi:putative sulfate exporter family transporter [Microbulbifer thermotolerans]|uniref:YeiH family protein n=1 Tax=Microbulbifer thermotolerans TaxID=252514 RepID=UPI00224B4C22|nr:putative sulfate exporter family transporter [Microbulbifer thermotolerans]MCX2841616.1 putative sulfate exporter family transporter [Microbulbifer thermotolerans]